MKSINSTLYNVILKGEKWTYNMPPCSKGATALLANNESIVTWISPKDNVNDCLKHIPVIFYKGKYWTLSLRMSKCIYRHVRLRKGFENRQTVHGIMTLRIPQLLLNEKKRTQARFEVCQHTWSLDWILIDVYKYNSIRYGLILWQKMHIHKKKHKSSEEAKISYHTKHRYVKADCSCEWRGGLR